MPLDILGWINENQVCKGQFWNLEKLIKVILTQSSFSPPIFPPLQLVTPSFHTTSSSPSLSFPSFLVLLGRERPSPKDHRRLRRREDARALLLNRFYPAAGQPFPLLVQPTFGSLIQVSGNPNP